MLEPPNGRVKADRAAPDGFAREALGRRVLKRFVEAPARGHSWHSWSF